MNTDSTPNLPGIDSLVQPFKFQSQPHEYKVTPLRECPTPDAMQTCDTPDKVADYWHRHIVTHPYYDPERECFVAIMLSTRRRVKGHYLVSIGTMDTILVHPREVFRLAIMTAASGIVLAHNLCAATHKLCYVKLRVMCSCRLVAHILAWSPRRKECYAR